MHIPLFYLFAAIMIIGGLMVVFMRNPVSSALAMVLSFIGLAGLFIGLNAYLVGILQILVYAGAIMVLFIFIIMLLDLKKEESSPRKGLAIAAGVIIPLIFLFQLSAVLTTQRNSPQVPELALQEAAQKYDEHTVIQKKLAAGSLPDIHLIGQKLYTEYNFPLQVVAVLLLVATVGCVSLSKRDPATAVAKKTPAPTRIPKVTPTPAPASSPEPIKEPVKEPVVENTTHDEKRGLIYTSRPDDIDDLKIISGVGPVLEAKLHDFGIYTYQQIALWTEENIAEFDELLTFKGRITRDDWLTQAADLHSKKIKKNS